MKACAITWWPSLEKAAIHHQKLSSIPSFNIHFQFNNKKKTEPISELNLLVDNEYVQPSSM